jgi:hypothetical protein
MTTLLQRASLDQAVLCADAVQVSLRSVPADDQWPLGAELVTRRTGYTHHGIYVGHGKVVHYAGLCRSSCRGPVEEISIERFAAGREVAVKANPLAIYVGPETVRRARSRLGENRYRLLTNNCEHFCSWCLYGRACSEQIQACFVQPRLAWQALSCLAKVFIRTRLHGMGHAATSDDERFLRLQRDWSTCGADQTPDRSTSERSSKCLISCNRPRPTALET